MVEQVPTVAKHRRDRLCGVDGAAAAEPDYDVAVCRASPVDPVADEVDGGLAGHSEALVTETVSVQQLGQARRPFR